MLSIIPIPVTGDTISLDNIPIGDTITSLPLSNTSIWRASFILLLRSPLQGQEASSFYVLVLAPLKRVSSAPAGCAFSVLSSSPSNLDLYVQNKS